MANDLSRLQVKENNDAHDWGDVGNKPGDEKLPVSFANETQLIDEASATVIYFGWAIPGSDTTAGKADARWKIKKIDTTTPTNQKISTWANGTDRYTNVWNDRATYTYS